VIPQQRKSLLFNVKEHPAKLSLRVIPQRRGEAAVRCVRTYRQ
jgi:hypothetical protein